MVKPPANPTDKYAELTALFRSGIAGDTASYGGFLQAVSALLRRTVGRKLPADDVEDVVQEILLSVHKARHTYDGGRPLIPWLSAIGQFRINDYLRKAYSGARWERVDIDALSETPADVTESAIESESVDELLQHVPEREKSILKMMHAEGYTAKETGRRLGMSESAVKVAAHRAIKKIREKF